MSIPFLMEFAVLTDREPTNGQGPDQGNFDERSFIFMNMRHMRDNREKMERYLRGEAPAPEDSAWSKSNVNFDAKKVIRRGQLEVGGQTVLYQASQGEISHKDQAAGGVSTTEKKDGIVTMVLPECADDRLRFGVWIGPSAGRGRLHRHPRRPGGAPGVSGAFPACARGRGKARAPRIRGCGPPAGRNLSSLGCQPQERPPPIL